MKKKRNMFITIICLAITALASGCSGQEPDEVMKALGAGQITKEQYNEYMQNEEIEIKDEEVPKADINTEEPEETCEHQWITNYETIVVTPTWDETILINPEWTETIVTKEAWTETILVKAAWDEKVMTKPAWTENILVKGEWDEKILVKPAWDEIIQIPEKTITEEYDICTCGKILRTKTESQNHAIEKLLNPNLKTCGSYTNKSVTKTIPAHTETIQHEAEYKTVHHAAKYKTVTHPAEYKTVHHEAEYETKEHPAETKTIKHEPEYKTIHHEEITEKRRINETCTKCKEIKQ